MIIIREPIALKAKMMYEVGQIMAKWLRDESGGGGGGGVCI